MYNFVLKCVKKKACQDVGKESQRNSSSSIQQKLEPAVEF